MERVYLLLRNAQESGPFTIGELLQQQLKPEDMIWVEGKSKAWTYLSELQLTPCIASPSEENKSAKPVDEIEIKAEELRRRILSSPTMYYTPKEVERASYSTPFYLPEKELEFVDHRKERNARRNAVAGELALTSIVIGLFVLGISKGNYFLSERKQVQNSVATQLNTNDEHTAHRKNNQAPVVITNASDAIQKMDSTTAIIKARPKTRVHAMRHDSTINQTSLQKNNLSITPSEKKEDAIAQKTVDQTAGTIKNESSAKKEEGSIKKETVASDTRNDKKWVEQPQEKKKGFFLKNLFRKKKKENELQH